MSISKEYIDYVKNTYNKNYTVEMAACALIEEINEFNVDNTTDEFGDILYQLVLFGLLLNIEFDMICHQEDVDAMIFTYITRITSQYKKRTTRGMSLDKDLICDNFEKLYNLIMKVAETYKLNVSEVEKENMKKLNERYGE